MSAIDSSSVFSSLNEIHAKAPNTVVSSHTIDDFYLALSGDKTIDITFYGDITGRVIKLKDAASDESVEVDSQSVTIEYSVSTKTVSLLPVSITKNFGGYEVIGNVTEEVAVTSANTSYTKQVRYSLFLAKSGTITYREFK